MINLIERHVLQIGGMRKSRRIFLDIQLLVVLDTHQHLLSGADLGGGGGGLVVSYPDPP